MTLSAVLSYAIRALIMLIALPFHEAAHAFASWKLGDSTAKDRGRMTLNPLAHLDPMGALCMIVAGIGWAKPVPINAARFRNPKWGMALSALAGPLSNLLLAYVGMILYKLLYYCAPVTQAYTYVAFFFYYFVVMNISLAVFNLLPVPPLDGSRLALTFLPHRLYFKVMQYERQIAAALFLLLMLHVLDGPLGWLRNGAWAFINWSTGYVDWLIYALLA